jgi:hypothetical protein
MAYLCYLLILICLIVGSENAVELEKYSSRGGSVTIQYILGLIHAQKTERLQKFKITVRRMQ